jgi:hypothetical protein
LEYSRGVAVSLFNGSSERVNTFLQWLVVLLVSLAAFLGEGAFGDRTVSSELGRHKTGSGHPVLERRVSIVENKGEYRDRAIEKNTELLEKIDEKLDKLSREIERIDR